MVRNPSQSEYSPGVDEKWIRAALVSALLLIGSVLGMVALAFVAFRFVVWLTQHTTKSDQLLGW